MPNTPTHFRQHGAVLIVSLLVLLVITVIGVSGLNASVMEQKMAANNQKLAESFQSAESAVKSTYFSYAGSADTLVNLAQSTTPSDRQFSYSLGDHTVVSAEVAYIGEVTPHNQSLGEGEPLTAYGIEVSGTGSIDNSHIASTTTQGYRVEPMLAP